jgi:hypothetical protein
MAMATNWVPRPQFIVLGVLLVAIAGLIVYNLDGSQQAAAPTTTSNAPRPTRGRQTPPTTAEELDLRIESLSQAKPAPEESDRNPFRFRPPPPPPSAANRPSPPVEEIEKGPETPPPPPPIPLKFIGVFEAARVGKVAALKDERGVYHAREGEIVVGQYRVVRIGVESIVLEYADGRGGRQTIRLSGQ